MLLDTPIDFAEAVKHLAMKSVMPTTLNSGQLRALGSAVLRQAVTSAQTPLSDYLDKVKAAVESIVKPSHLAGEALNPATAREQLKAKLADLGYAPAAGEEGTIKDLSSDGRIDLVVKTNTELAQGAGKFVQGNLNEEVIDLWPAWELVRYEEAEKPRDWEKRWMIAAQVAGDADAAGVLGREGRMVALKSSDIWQELGDGAGGYMDTLGNPYPPFAFNSGMWTDDVSRKEAEELGLLEEGEKVEGAEFDFASLFEAAA